MTTDKRDNTGQPYEILVQGIFQAIHDQDEVKTLIVERNKTLQGKTTSHQIDVYWKFEKSGIAYETIVQAKDWASTVNQGQLLQFKGVLDDLPSQPRGIFVTRTGYQQGAKNFAAAHGIILYELNEPPKRPHTGITTLGWIKFEPELRSFKLPAKSPDQKTVEELVLGVKSTVFEPRYSNIEFQIDSPWHTQNIPTSQLGKSHIKLNPLPLLKVILYDPTQAPTSNLEEVVRQEIAIMRDEKLGRKHVVHIFDRDTFLAPPCTDDIFVKITKVSFDLEIEVTQVPAQFILSKFVQVVLREIPSEKARTFLAPKTD
jgi:hypothetical protein